MKTHGSFVRTASLVTAACALLSPRVAQAVLITSPGTGRESGAIVWVCLAAFVLCTLGVAFWKSKWREAE
jgi:hypothetical protein